MKSTRRTFLTAVGAAAATAGAPLRALAQQKPDGFGVRFAYHAITWGGKDLQAIEEIAAAGFKGIQLRSNLVAEYGSKPAALKDVLDKHGLKLVCFSSGNVRIAPEAEKETLDQHTRHAQFVKALDGMHLQVVDERPKGRPVGTADFKRMGGLLTDLGKRCADLGVTLVYHNHMNNLGESPSEVAGVLGAADPRYLKLLLDMAHYKQGGGDPVSAVSEYRDRIALLHFKDVVSPAPNRETERDPGHDGRASYKFVELGRGSVDIPGVVAALKKVSFNGWGVIELDAVPEPNRTPKESMAISKQYVQDTLKLTV